MSEVDRKKWEEKCGSKWGHGESKKSTEVPQQ